MKRHIAVCLAVCSLCASVASTAWAIGSAPSKLIEETQAEAVGLTREWFAQVTLDPSFEKVTSATCQDGVILATTDAGVLQVIDAEKGTTLWSTVVGSEYLFPPALNSKIVVAICGTRMVVYDRFSGDKLDETELYAQPSAGPRVSEREIYVPTYGEKIFAYAIKPEKLESKTFDATLDSMKAATKDFKSPAAVEFVEKNLNGAQNGAAKFRIEKLDDIRPYTTATFGVPNMQPVMGSQAYDLDVVAWTSDQGWMVLASMQRNIGDAPFRLLYKFQTRPYFSFINERRLGNRAQIPRVDIESIPFFVPIDKSAGAMATDSAKRRGGLFVVGSRSGHVFAMNDVTGDLRWTYITERPVSGRISAFGEYAFVPTQAKDLYAVRLRDGSEAWRADGVLRVVAASATRLYVIDTLEQLAILDIATGRRIKTLDIGNTSIQVFNSETDRVYLVSEDGLVQCLHETQLSTPIRHIESCGETYDRIMAQMRDEEPVKETADDANVAEEPAAQLPADATDASTEEEEDPASAFEDEEESGDDAFGDESSDSDADPFADSGDEDDPF